MSRIGKQPINIPTGVTVNLSKEAIAVKGPKGSLDRQMPPYVKVELADSVLTVNPVSNERRFGAFHGLARSLIANMVQGVTDGFEKKLQIEGVGYRVALQGQKLVFHLGYSSPVEFDLPKGIDAEVGDKGVNFSIKGIDKELVGQTAATIRGLRAPEPYKGKGIRYADEHIRRKAGKAGVK
ncbi:MAG: 50S ribosomal protein L6 [Deltaproteobacteria bacterium]|nr:50S ribosomal protein L6 [Deltaproteobacteria bacterium]MBN2673242.1 50S ribosomal protein L6 [Deltaproteobacteria bacterium]